MPLDWSSVTNPQQALALIFKKKESRNIYQKNNVFQAIALTPGYTLTAQEAKSLQSSFKPRKAEDTKGKEDDKKRFSRIYFKGRILGPNSPHSFLPNPKDIEVSEGIDNAIALHTTFVMTTDVKDGVMPKPNDIFTVALRPGSDNTPFNLQIGDVLYRTNPGAAGRRRGQDSLSSLFTDGGGFTVALDDYVLDDSVCDADPPKFYLSHPLGGAAYITSPFGLRASTKNPGTQVFHDGADFGARVGTPLYAAAKGTVSALSIDASCGGNIIYIDHDSDDGIKYKTYSMHLNEIGVEVGDEVSAGDLIGTTGGTAGLVDKCTGGPHLHFVFYVDGVVTDPLEYIKTLVPCGMDILEGQTKPPLTKADEEDADLEAQLDEIDGGSSDVSYDV